MEKTNELTVKHSKSPSINPVPFSALFTSDVKSYIAECIAASQSSTKVFFHLPKTGGTSIRTALNEEIQKVLHIKKYSELGQWNQVLKQQKEAPYGLISGHLNSSSLNALYAAGEPIMAITFIRDPMERILSQYRYMVSSKYPNHLEFRENFEGLKDFIQDGLPKNPMLSMLLGECSTIDQAMHLTDKNFMFVGLAEYSAMHSFLIQRCFGLKKFHIPGRINQTVSSIENAVTLDASTIDLIKDKCALDIEFYTRIKEMHISIADQIFSALYEVIAGNVDEILFPPLKETHE